MSKQEKILEGIADKFLNYKGTNYQHATAIEKKNALTMAQNVVSYLRSQGVVLKAERQLPSIYINPNINANSTTAFTRPGWFYNFSKEDIYLIAQMDMIRSGYTAWEPLIKEE